VSNDYRDLALEMLADAEAALREEVVAYRQLALAALDQLHQMTRRLERLTRQHQRLVDECRALRAQVNNAEAA
jgi:hypothetical protein